jgi:hypothetical protein
MKAHEAFLPLTQLEENLETLKAAIQKGSLDMVKAGLGKLVPGYKSSS